MKAVILRNISKIFAKIYWAYLKPEIDNYILSSQKNKFKFFGNNVTFKGSGEIFHPENIIISDNVQIGSNYFLMGVGGIEIGEGTIISRNVCIHSGNHDFKSSGMIPYNKDYILKKISIGKGVWIGQNVNILPGVKIGDGAIIGMGTSVSKNVGNYEIVVGGQQRVIGERNQHDFDDAIKKDSFYAKYY